MKKVPYFVWAVALVISIVVIVEAWPLLFKR